ncbi:MAG: HAD hydrolase family protein [Microbacteriaceae bacterium]|jgi:hydroxymethylpyrimidine pyrophosphatase-like HAD family hydrolase|nr:HAD hydrolase family protein [Microbacteriaceae bacterium]
MSAPAVIPYRAVVFLDLDGTLLDDSHRAGDDAHALLRRMRRADVLPVMATARNTWEVRDLLGEEAAATGVVSSGCVVRSRGTVLDLHTVPKETLAALVAQASDLGDDLGFFTEEQYAVTARSETVLADMQLLGEAPESVPVDPDLWLREQLSYVCVYAHNGDITPYREAFGEALSLTPFSDTAYTGLPAGASKANGASRLLRKDPRARHAPTFSFGDERNDCELSELVDVGVAMPGSRPELLAVANETAPAAGPAGIEAVLRRHGLLDPL